MRNAFGEEERVYRFGDYRLFPARQSLLRGSHSVRIGSRALDLLRLLVEQPGVLLTKGELLRQAWPDTFVHEDNLKVNIGALRRALGETGSGVPYIATVPGRGYRFVATVQVEQAATTGPFPSPIQGDVGGLPRSPSIVGRDDDIGRIAEALTWRRFVSIVGPAGVGKTTAAVAVARQAARHFPDGTCFVDLAAIGDPQFVTTAVASGVGAAGNLKDLLLGIVDALRGQRRLLILDNCEHVLRAASVVAEHIHATLPDIAILATSREPFRSRTETVYRLPPLSCPAWDDRIDQAEAMTFAAVELFAARADEAAGFTMTDATAPIVGRICRRLDGIPLAIELAASRLRSCDAATLLRLLEQSFEPLSYGPADAPLRQQTLMATLDWSYRLLSQSEAAVLRVLSVFAGAFTVQDAVGVGRHLRHSPEDIANCIDGLATKSLLSSSFSEDGLQYRLLDATRSYAAERLRGAGEQRRVATAHAEYLLDLFARAESEWHWRVREDWTGTYGSRTNDLRKALDWSFGEDGDPALSVKLTAAAIPLWDELSSVVESRRQVRRALASAALVDCDPVLRMKLTTSHAWSLTYTSRFEPEGEAEWLESRRLAELTGDIDYQLRALWGLAIRQCFHGQHRQVLEILKRFAFIAERENDHAAVPTGERLRVTTEFYLGDVRGAHEALKELARRYDTVARRSRLARFQIDWYVGIRVSLALSEWVCGHPEEAMAMAQAALDGATEIGHAVSQANVLVLAAIPVALWTGRIDEAERHLAELVSSLNQRDIAIWELTAHFFEGAIRHERGDAEGIEQMRTTLAELVAGNFLVRTPAFFSMLAEAALQRGLTDIARESVALAQDRLERQQEYWCRPEVLRVRGLIQWHDGDVLGGELTLLRAAKYAEDSGALTFELRAALALAEIWAATGRAGESLALLDPLCGRFDATTQSRDLAQARSLLARLRSPSEAVAHGEMTSGQANTRAPALTPRRAAARRR